MSAPERAAPGEPTAAAQAPTAPPLPDLEAARARLASVFAGRLLVAEPLRLHTSYRVGGPADLLAVATTNDEVRALVRAAVGLGLPWRVLGKGTNVLVADRGIRGLVIKNLAHTFEVAERREDGATLRADAGVACAHLASQTGKLGLTGFEFAILIPGSIGGAVVQNAGAHGGEMVDVLERVESMAPDGSTIVRPLAELDLAYRHSRFKGASRPETVLAAWIRLRQGDPAAIQTAIRENRERRTRTQPGEPSAGSVFKNPPGSYAGYLIEQAGLKGVALGGARVSPKHANFIINTGNATAAEVRTLIEYVRATVLERFGVALQTEIEPFGEW